MTQETKETSGDLMLFQMPQLPQTMEVAEKVNKAFTGVYDKIKAEIAELDPDTSTDKKRKAIASLAYKIARTKTGLDEAAAAVAAENKKIVDAVNAERRSMKETLDQLRDKARKPLNDWEAAEAERVAKAKEIETTIHDLHNVTIGMTSADVQSNLNRVLEIKLDPEIFTDPIDLASMSEAVLLVIKDLETAITRIKQAETDRAELEALRAKAKAEEEAKAAAEAEELRKQEEARAEEEAQRIEAEAKAKAERQAQEALDAERRKIEQQREELARQAIEAKARIEQEEKEAEERRAQYLEQEKKRLADEAKAQEAERKRVEQQRIDADKARQEDLEHRKKINNSAADALSKVAEIPKEDAQAIIKAIAKGQVPGVTINY